MLSYIYDEQSHK